MDYIIRKAESKDVDEITKLACLLADHHNDVDQFWQRGDKVKNELNSLIKTNLEKEGVLYFVVESDDKIVGYFSAEIKMANPVVSVKKIGFVSNAFLIDEWRGKGITRIVMNKIFDWFKENNVTVIELVVDTNNENGIKVWEKIGFKEHQKKMKMDL